MRFIIQRDLLNELINKVQSIVPIKPTMPVLGSILMIAGQDELVLVATDLTGGIRCFVDAEILEEGTATLPAKKFAQLVREMQSGSIEISTSPQQITTIKAGGSRFKLNGMDPSLFPNLPSLDEAFSFKIDQKELKDLLSSVAFAVSKEENRHALTGVLMQIKEGVITFFGTDGKRLARSSQRIAIDSGYASDSILPIKFVEEMIKHLGEKEDVTLSILSDKVGMECEKALIVTKLLSGDYPDLSRLLEKREDFSVSLHREELSLLLRQVSLFTEDMSHSARFVFQDGELELSANKASIGEGRTTMVVNYTGPRFEIAFNPTFFLDILRHCREETVSLRLIDAYNPGIITDNCYEEGKHSPSTFLLMPMRLSDD